MRAPSYPAYLTAHAIGWLCLANGVGLLLGFLLLAPSLNSLLAPVTYGRLIPVHLNGQLYGWCFLPLIGLLFSAFPAASIESRRYRLSVDAWTVALGFGCLSWLAGRTSGKLFMEWSGASRVVLPAAMLFLAGALLMTLIQDIRRKGFSVWADGLRSLLWLVLIPVPFIMYWASSPTLFPPINPDSGGATGGDLLISSLGAVSIIWLCPYLLGLPRRHGRKAIALFILLQVVHYLAFAAMEHGDQSNYNPVEIVGLLSLLIWIPLLAVHFRGFDWPRHASRWLWALVLWAAFLVISANIMFLPHILDRWKFTHMVVGHTHAAMAGMLSAFNVLVLLVLNRNTSWADVLGKPSLFWLWNIATLIHVAALKGLGSLEGASPGVLYRETGLVDSFFWLRLLAGVLMFTVSAVWLHQGVKGCRQTQEEKSHV